MASAAPLSVHRSATIGADLERSRLQLRARHVRIVLALLRERTGASARPGRARPGLEQTIRELSAELSSISRQLQEPRPGLSAPPRSGARAQRTASSGLRSRWQAAEGGEGACATRS